MPDVEPPVPESPTMPDPMPASPAEREAAAGSELQAVLAKYECTLQMTLLIVGKTGTLFPYAGDEVVGRVGIKAN